MKRKWWNTPYWIEKQEQYPILTGHLRMLAWARCNDSKGVAVWRKAVAQIVRAIRLRERK